jgi:hypothetical protein
MGVSHKSGLYGSSDDPSPVPSFLRGTPHAARYGHGHGVSPAAEPPVASGGGGRLTPRQQILLFGLVALAALQILYASYVMSSTHVGVRQLAEAQRRSGRPAAAGSPASLPSSTSRRRVAAAEQSSGGGAADSTLTTSYVRQLNGPCPESAQHPYQLGLKGEAAFPELAAWLTANLPIFEDVYPGGYWVIGRDWASGPIVNGTRKERDFIDWSESCGLARTSHCPQR